MATTTKHFNTDQSAMVAQRRRKIERLFSVKVSVQPVPDRNLLHDIKICGAKLDMCNASVNILILSSGYSSRLEFLPSTSTFCFQLGCFQRKDAAIVVVLAAWSSACRLTRSKKFDIM